MRRLYYLADDLDTVCRVAGALQGEGLRRWRLHVLSKNADGLYQHNIHSASALHRLDILHSGERLGLIGALLGLTLGLALYVVPVLPWAVNLLTVLLLGLAGFLFGAWQGVLLGRTRENYRIAPFHDEIEAGRYLLMIDVSKDQKCQVRELINLQFPRVRHGGISPVLPNPLDPLPRPLRR